jgi:hypothetical protein
MSSLFVKAGFLFSFAKGVGKGVLKGARERGRRSSYWSCQQYFEIEGFAQTLLWVYFGQE